MRLRSSWRDDAVGRRLVLARSALLLLALHALGELAQELVHRLAQLVGEALDLLVGGAALQRLAQALLGGAQLALGLGQVAVLDLQRHRPEPVGDLEEVGVVLRAGAAARRRRAGPGTRPIAA